MSISKGRVVIVGGPDGKVGLVTKVHPADHAPTERDGIGHSAEVCSVVTFDEDGPDGRQVKFQRVGAYDAEKNPGGWAFPPRTDGQPAKRETFTPPAV